MLIISAGTTGDTGIHGELLGMNKLLEVIEKMQIEFERILEQGFDENSPMYEYFGDLKTMAKASAKEHSEV